jgi:hypothetical protein
VSEPAFREQFPFPKAVLAIVVVAYWVVMPFTVYPVAFALTPVVANPLPASGLVGIAFLLLVPPVVVPALIVLVLRRFGPSVVVEGRSLRVRMLPGFRYGVGLDDVVAVQSGPAEKSTVGDATPVGFGDSASTRLDGNTVTIGHVPEGAVVLERAGGERKFVLTDRPAELERTIEQVADTGFGATIGGERELDPFGENDDSTAGDAETAASSAEDLDPFGESEETTAEDPSVTTEDASATDEEFDGVEF